MPDPKRILIVKLTALGDILCALPMLRPLRERFPDAYIAWALQVGEELVRHNPDINEVINVGRGRGLRGGLRWIRDIKKLLRPLRFDIALDVQGLAKSGLVAWASGAREIVGFKGRNCRELNWLFTSRRYRPPEDRHVAVQNMHLLTHFGIEADPDIPGLNTAAEDEAMVTELLDQIIPRPSDFIIMHPGVSRANKRWPPEHAARLCELIAGEYEYPVLLTCGSQDEYDLCLDIKRRVKSGPGPEAVPRLGLGQFVGLVKRSLLFIGNDSGPAHMAFSAGIPTVFLFGPTLAWRNGGYACARGRSLNIESPVKRQGDLLKPYIPDTGFMEQIRPETVMDDVRHFLTSGTFRNVQGEG